MDPQNPYQQPQQPASQPSPGGLPPLQPQQQAPAQQPQPQPQVNPSYTSQYAQQQFSQPFEQPGVTTQPAVDYGAQPSDQQREQFSIDYLNKIAPKEQKTVNRFAVFGLIGAVIFSAIFGVILLSISNSGTDANSMIPKLDARIQSLKTATAAQQTHLTETEIYEVNASLTSALGSMDAELQAVMKDRKLKKLSDKTAVANEKAYLATLTKTLDDAYQRGTLDRTYVAQMNYQLSLLRGQIIKLKKASSSNTIRTFSDNSLKSIDITLKSYANFSATKS